MDRVEQSNQGVPRVRERVVGGGGDDGGGDDGGGSGRGGGGEVGSPKHNIVGPSGKSDYGVSYNRSYIWNSCLSLSRAASLGSSSSRDLVDVNRGRISRNA